MHHRSASALLLFSFLGAPAFAADLPARAPGLWQSITSALGPDGQPLPNAQNVISVSCVDAQNDQKFFLTEADACTGLAVSGAGGSYHITAQCMESSGVHQLNETLTYQDAKDVTLKAVYETRAGQMTITSQLQWQGACLPGMQPGDEGSIINGSFSKADNINDPDNR
ncbi:DUF3617 family protein [Acidocella sp.]|jgi:hypothetical protein|uniref:DUF3617 domain-containing protein n=1 Tax=Acidocella sp. TaxID=50710 RepID=UPI002615C480|nr:DUF3617 family protein [Acidocella sp.]